MDVAAWRARSSTALAIAAARARRGDQRIACGFTNNVDVVVTLDGGQFSRLVRDVGAGSPTAAISHAATPAALLRGLRWFLERGQGGEVVLTNPAMADWIAARFAGRRQLGGTGAQAAQTLARLGFAALLHVTSLSPAQAALIDSSGRLLVATPDGPRPPAEAARPDDPTLTHFIFEYSAGLPISLPDRTIVSPQANRVIVSFNPLHARLPLAPYFLAAVANPDNRVRRVLLSGYNQIADPATAAARYAETAAAIRCWRRALPGLLVHLELAAMPEPAVAATLLDALPPHADSIGCNADELAAALALHEAPAAGDIEGTLRGLLTLQHRLERPRLGLHTQDYCLTLTRHDPTIERDALLYAALVAGARAGSGDFPVPADLHAALARAEPSPIGLAAMEHLAATVGLHDGIACREEGWLVAVPTIATPHPTGTVGLGDSFTAGLLAML